MKIIAVFLSIVFGAEMLPAQGKYPHSLAVGLKSGTAEVSDWGLNTSIFMLDLNHQANINGFFSWRTALRAGYMFPAQTLVISELNPTVEDVDLLDYEHGHFNLITMPMIYHRDDGFTVFAGFGGGIGVLLWQKETFASDLGGNIEERKSEISRLQYQYGISPVIGVSLPLGDQKAEQEIEISFSREDWWTLTKGDYGPWKSALALQVSYRYNFRDQ